MFNQQVSLGTDDLTWDRWESQPYGPPEDGLHLSDIGTWPFLKSTVVPKWVGNRSRVADLADDSIEAGADSGGREHGWNVTLSDIRKHADANNSTTHPMSRNTVLHVQLRNNGIRAVCQQTQRW